MRLSAGKWCGNGLGEPLLTAWMGSRLFGRKWRWKWKWKWRAREWIGMRGCERIGMGGLEFGGKSGVGCACLGRVG
jgi:hypothetical protein